MDIPLFPLPNLVLFPNVIIPLHIFEERYKLMINTCIDTDESFGLVLLRGEGQEETAEMIHRVGVTARVIQVDRLGDGRLNIFCQGETRFRIHRFTQQKPYWKASVDFFEEDQPALRDESLYARVSDLYRKIFELGIKLNAGERSELTLPESPTGLSFVVSYILELESEEKQRLLEMTSTSDRLEVLVVHMEETVRRIEQQIAYKVVTAKVRGNGDLGKPATS